MDNLPALRRALEAASRAGGEVRLGLGRYELASEGLAAHGSIARPDFVALRGHGARQTELAVTGAAVVNELFLADNGSDILTADLTITGNGKGSEAAPYAGALLRARLNEMAARDLSGVRFERCVIENFASAAWMYLLNRNRHFAIRSCGSVGCSWRAMKGTAPGAGDLAVPGHFIYAYGEIGPIQGLAIDDELMDAEHVKGGVACIGNVAESTIRIGELRRPGRGLAATPSGPDGPGLYGVLLYRRPNAYPRNIIVRIGRLIEPYSCGVYAAGASGLKITIDYAAGQRDVRDFSLPKGVLALNGCNDVGAEIGKVEDCARVLSVVLAEDAPNGGAQSGIRIALHDVRSSPGAHDVVIGARGKLAGGLVVVGRRQGKAGVAVEFRGDPQTRLQAVDLSGLASTGAVVPVSLPHGLAEAAHGLRLPS